MAHSRRVTVGWRAVLFVLLACFASPAATEAEGPKVGERTANFSLLDYGGRHYELRRTPGKAVVLFFTGSNCPISRQTGPKLQALADEFGPKGVVVWLVNATPQNDPGPRKLDAMYELGRFAPREILGDRYAVKQLRDLVPESVLGDRETIRRETLPYVFGSPPLPPILCDAQQLVSRYFGVDRTCEAVVIEAETSRVLYRGAVDDQFAEGARRPQPTKQFLRDALEEFLSGKPIATPTSKVHGCAITYTALSNGREVTYTHDVAPILRARCVSCHSAGEIGPFEMSGYEKVKGWSAMIREVVLDRRMPPWHADPHFGKFSNDRSLSAAESNALVQWVADGCPRGEGKDPLDLGEGNGGDALVAAAAIKDVAPAPPDWKLGKPDFVVRLPEQEVPATGAVDYRYIDSDFVVPDRKSV